MRLALALTLLAGWQPAQPVAGLDTVRATAGADGSVHVTTAGLDGPVAVRGAPPGGVFGPPRTLVEGPGNLWNDVDGSGTVTVLLEARDPGDPGPAYGTHPAHGLSAAVAAPGQPLGAATLISTPGRRTIAWGLDVAASGAAVAGWLEEDNGKWYATAAVRAPGAPAFGPPRRVSKAVPQREYVNVAVSERGDALVEWESGAYGTTGAHVALARPGGEFGPEVMLTPRAGTVQIAVGADGTAFVAAEHRRAFTVRAFVAAPNEAFGAFQTLRCQRADGAAVAADGRILLACGHAKELQAWEGRARLRRTARLSRSGREQVDTPVDVALDPGGRALVVFEDRVTRIRTVLKAALRTGARFSVASLTGRHESVYPGTALLLPGGGALVLGGFGDIGKGSGTFSVRYAPEGAGPAG